MKRASLLDTFWYSPSRRLSSSMAFYSSMNQITPCLYLGNANAASSRRLLAAKGINCVINASLEVPNPILPNVDYFRVLVADLPHAHLSEYFDSVADRIHQVEKRNGRTLVHCVAGVSRSAALCIAYLMKYEQMTLREAHHWVKSRRPIIRPNVGFWRQLMEYERRLFGKNSVRMSSSSLGMVPYACDKSPYSHCLVSS
ncbi:dual specificity protein phosphatase 14-like [Protopterus annectens]|uniref:dual specificity protein phosphatase 14-like n=1 Tax=Protopterus annectens TaxID=7888 RepID=UPI001CFB0800|nr:dual specificity protein phosphatase 14-like [Protopterus annectens]